MSTRQPIYEYVMQHLDAKAVPQKVVAAESGVPFSTVCKIAQRDVIDPRVQTVQRLADYFASKEKMSGRRSESGSSDECHSKEAA